MYGYYGLNRKKHKARVRHAMKALNQNILNDDLWRGRFYVTQIENPRWERFEDGSGAELGITLAFIDRATGNWMIWWGTANQAVNGHESMWWKMNQFITEYSGVYGDGHNPWDEKIDPKDYQFKLNKSYEWGKILNKKYEVIYGHLIGDEKW